VIERKQNCWDINGVPGDVKCFADSDGELEMEIYGRKVPEKISELILENEYETDHIGMSDSSILLFRDKVLKIQKTSRESENEYCMMLWLKGKLPVPKMLAHEQMDNTSYLLMSRCKGEMACEQKFMENPKKLTAMLAGGLKSLWNIDIADCLADWCLKNKLSGAAYNVEHGLVDLEHVEETTFGKDGFQNPEKLLQWLYDNQPKEELVLSHGDFCLPNIFLDDGGLSGIIDLGKTGIADKWCDIAICYRSMLHNYDGKYNGTAYEGWNGSFLFQELGIEPDIEKLRYYILLDELF